MKPLRGKAGRSGRVGRLLALLCLVAGSLFGPAAFAHASSDFTAGNLPDWAIGPFTRQAQPNPAPVLTPESSGWDSQYVLNPGVVYRNGAFQMLYRADGGGADQIGLATSTDGLNFTRNAANPVITNNVQPDESGGVDDPRLYELNGTYYSFISGYDWSNSPPQTIMETTSTDLVHWTTAVPIVNSTTIPRWHGRQRHAGAAQHPVRPTVRHVLR